MYRRKNKSKVIAGILAIFFGDLGLHKFYMGDIVLGILYLGLSWTGVPFIISIIEGIRYLTMRDEDFSKLIK